MGFIRVLLFSPKSNVNRLGLAVVRNQTPVIRWLPIEATVFSFRIGHDNKGGFAGWFLDKVEIDSKSLGTRWVFPCGRWFDKGKDDGLLERDLYPVEDGEQVYTKRESFFNYNRSIPLRNLGAVNLDSIHTCA